MSIRRTSGGRMIGPVLPPAARSRPCSRSFENASARWNARSAIATPSRPTPKRAAFIMMNAARFGVGLEGVAIAERAFQRALAFSKERLQGRDLAAGGKTGPTIRHPDVPRRLPL